MISRRCLGRAAAGLRRRGVCRAPPFTLLELAVVLGIIVLLAALLLPALGQARDRARLGQCAAQVRQIGIALHAYAVDSRDRLPDCARLGPEPGSGLPSLAAVLAPYSEAQARLFACPADLGAGAAALFARTGTSYEWNTFVNGRRIDRSSWRIAGLEVVTPLAGDADAFHGGGLRNYLYADGRVTAAFEVLLQP